MRTCFLIVNCLLAFIISGNSQELPTKDGKVFYEIIDSIKASKEELYSRSKIWLVNSFRDSKSALEIDSKESGQILGKGNTNITYQFKKITTTLQLNFIFRIDLKEGKYRFQIYNFNYQSAAVGAPPMSIEDLKSYYNGVYYDKIIPPTNDKILALLQSFKEAMTKKTDTDF